MAGPARAHPLQVSLLGYSSRVHAALLGRALQHPRRVICVHQSQGRIRKRALSARASSPSPITTSKAKPVAQPTVHPFTRAELDRIAERLSPVPDHHPSSFPAHTASYTDARAALKSGSESRSGPGPKEAAVLIPLMNVDGAPHVLLEVRATQMRTHAGELSFPGGRIDPTDTSIAHAALREAQEELALSPEHVEVLGALEAPEYSLGNRSRVWAIVAFIHSHPTRTPPPHTSRVDDPLPSPGPLPSFPLDTLRPSPSEVSALLPLPLPHLLDPQRRALHLFRIDARRPYWKIGVGDLVPPAPSPAVRGGPHDLSPPPPTPPPTPTMRADELEVWGLTGWFLNVLAWRLGWMERPPPLADPED